jgi:hypothetical protein
MVLLDILNQDRKMLYLKILGLSGLLFVLKAIDFLSLSLDQTVVTYPSIFIIQSLIDASLVSLLIMNCRWSGWKLIAAIFLVFYGIDSFLVGMEGYYLSDLLTSSSLLRIFVNGAIVA